jgi:integrase
LGLFREDLNLRTRLPQRIKKTPYCPTREDVKALLDASYGTDYEIALKLACYGLRRSEICALTPDDIQGNKVIINKGLVKNSDNEFVLKPMPKTSASIREIYISDELRDRIKEVGLYQGYPGCINKYLSRTLKRLGIEHFSLHKLRHYFVSVLSENGVDDATIMSLGGYETDRVMKSVYRHSMADENRKEKILNEAGLI